jgi:hypothetical protein
MMPATEFVGLFLAAMAGGAINAVAGGAKDPATTRPPGEHSDRLGPLRRDLLSAILLLNLLGHEVLQHYTETKAVVIGLQ